MAVRDTGPSDDEFSKLLDARAPNRLKDPEPLPAHSPSPTLLEDVPEVEDEEPNLGDEPELVAEVTAPVVPEKYAGKSVEEIARMHQELEQKLGQQGQELGELRALRSELDQMKGALQAAQAPQPPPITQETVDWVEEAMLGNPFQAMAWVEQNQPALKERALQTWAAMDPYSASAYRTEQLLKEQDAKWQERLAAVEAPFRAQQTDTQLERAYLAVSNSLPGFADVVEDLPAILEANPELKVGLVNGDLAQKQRILGNLGKMALADRALAQTNSVATEQAPAEPNVNAAKVAAAVASGSSTGEHGGETVTAADRLKTSMLAASPTSLHEELARNRAAAR